MIYSNYQNEYFSLSKFNSEDKLRQFSTEEENELISDNTSISRQLNIISFMTKKNIEEDISFKFNENNANNIRDDTTDKENMKMYYISIYKKKFIVEKESTKKGSKRGRKNQKNNVNGKNKTHDKNSSDNLLSKIQNHYLNFIISFMNEIFKFFNIRQQLKGLDHKFKSNVSKKHVEYLKTTNIRDIICHEISTKYKIKRDINNKSICDKIKNKVLNTILSENYLKLFRKVYYNKSNIINLKEYGLDKDIILSDKVKLFKNWREMNSNNEYRINIDQFVIKHFFPLIFNVKKKSTRISNK